jgi:outer membrane receptor protein involved in Fe transport
VVRMHRHSNRSRQNQVPTRRLLVGLSLALVLFPALVTSSLAAGRIEGKVLEAGTNKALAYANVIILNTTWGAMTQADGSFAISPLPPGSYEVRATFVGYETATQRMELKEGETLQITFRLKATVTQTREVTIKADRPLVDVKRASTIRSLDENEMKAMALTPTLDSVVEQQPGVTKDNDQIHIRGGRADETLYIVDGVKTRDLLSGDSKGNTIGSRSVAEVNIITGGFDAKYGQALSGIVEAKLKEGTDVFSGYVGYTTDNLVDDQNFDYYEVQFSGPSPVLPKVLGLMGVDDPGKMKFFLDLSTTVNDGWLPSIADLPGTDHLISSYQDQFLGKSFRYEDFFTQKPNNAWRALFKTTWRVTKSDKIDFSFTKNLTFDQGFGESDIADINRNQTNYPYTWSQRFDHYYTNSADQNSLSLIWNSGIRKNLVHQLSVTRFYTGEHRDVRGMYWWDYDTVIDSDVLLPQDDTPYFRDVGDAPDYRDRFVETWNFSTDWTWVRGRQKYDWGWSHQLENVQYMTMDATTVSQPDKPLGDEFDLFHVYPASGALYVQDRLEYESLVGGLGLRYDYWFPGDKVTRDYDNWETLNRPTINQATRDEYYASTHSIFGHRFKGHLSPRLQISHPITENDNLFFNYGHFSQRPAYFYVYAKSSSISSEEFPRIGNPNLNPEISVQYELGAGHQFRPDLALKSSVFYKDIYDYPTSTTLVLQERTTTRSNFFIYRNLDYARSTGIELEFRKRRIQHWSGAVTYTYAVAKGKSSDPNNLKLVQESGGDARETELGEIYMWWNRPHKLTAWYSLLVERGAQYSLFGKRMPSDWNFYVYTMFLSGRAYTPTDPFGNKTGQDYSRNGPLEMTTNLKFRKGFRLIGLDLEGTFEVFNLFNNRTPLTFDTATGEKYTAGEGTLYSPYQDPANLSLSDDELIEITGATVGPDQTVEEVAAGIRRTIEGNVSSYTNPSYRAAPRSIRIGVGVDW